MGEPKLVTNSVLFVLLAGLASASLGEPSARSRAQQPPEPDERVQTACAALTNLLEPAATFVAGLGSPANRTDETIQNPHETRETDSKTTLRFPGLEVVLFQMPATEAEIVELRVKRNLPQVTFPVAIGDAFASITRKLGGPQRQTKRYVEYDCSFEEGATLRFYTWDSRVSEIEWLDWPD